MRLNLQPVSPNENTTMELKCLIGVFIKRGLEYDTKIPMEELWYGTHVIECGPNTRSSPSVRCGHKMMAYACFHREPTILHPLQSTTLCPRLNKCIGSVDFEFPPIHRVFRHIFR